MSNNNQIPTAYEFLHRDESGVFNEVDITQAMEEYAKLHVEQIKQFLYGEICERREYSASRMCEEVLKFIEQMSNNNNQIEQEQIIEAIIQRIKDEDKKHSKSIEDWYRIAANKIYATFDIKIKGNYEQ